MSAASPSGDPGASAWSRLRSIISTLNAASFISLFVGLCYFYDHAYRRAYFGLFGLDASVIPVSLPDAVAEGFFGIVANVMLVITILAGIILLYVVILWFLGRGAEKLMARWGIPLNQPLPHPALAELGKSVGFRASFVASLAALVTTIVSMLALFVIALPAEKAARKEAAALRERVASSKGECARYAIKGSAPLIGWRIGSSPDRQFILAADHAVHIVKFDDLEQLGQGAVPCQAAGRPGPAARERKLPDRAT